MNRGSPWTWLAGLALLSLVALFAYAPIFAVDAFWHLKLGEFIVARLAIPDQDLFSAVHPERPYVQFQWLWDVLAFAAVRAGGLHGVRLFSVATMVASFALLAAVAARAFANRALAFAFCAFALVLFEDRFQTRPSTTALGFTAAMLPIWLGLAEGKLRREIVYTALLACLWSNVHGGEALLASLGWGALAVGDQISARLWPSDGGATARKRSSLLAIAALVGTACSPTFLPGLLDWSWAIQPQLASGNKEWLPTYTMLRNGFTPSFVLIAFAPTLVLGAYVWEQHRLLRARDRRAGPLPIGEWLLCAGMLVLSQQAVRNAFLCIVPLSFMFRRVGEQVAHLRGRMWASLAGATLLVVAFDDHVLQGYGGLYEASRLIRHDLAPSTFPTELTSFVRAAGIEGGMFNDARWGGWLIWELWPQNHVFVDSRQDLDQEMWPLFLAAQSAGTRAQAMEKAFQRWGIGLSVFRGPTFPAVRAPGHYQLLYKAGDQELYQHRGAANAAQNIERARSYLARWARDGTAPLEVLATEVGAARWLAAPYQRFRAQQAEALLGSEDAREAREGLRLKASLWFEAGLYPAALEALDHVLRAEPDNVRALYQAMLASLALGDEDHAQSLLKRLRPLSAQLTPPQLNRLRAIQARDFL